MSIESVRQHFKTLERESEILEFETSSATVELAAQALNCEPGKIAKTLAFKLKDREILLVTKGDMRIDNKKFKGQFKTKAKFLSFDEVLEITGHPVGGVCPFGLANPMEVYLDESMKVYDFVYPAAGSANSAIKLAPDEIESITQGTWVDVCKE